jgi:hypothetical protein
LRAYDETFKFWEKTDAGSVTSGEFPLGRYSDVLITQRSGASSLWTDGIGGFIPQAKAARLRAWVIPALDDTALFVAGLGLVLLAAFFIVPLLFKSKDQRKGQKP